MTDAFNIAIQNCFTGSPIPLKFNFWTTPPSFDINGNPIPGVPNDISGWTFLFTWKKNLSDLDANALYLLDWSIAAGGGTSGSTGLIIPGDNSANVPAKTLTFWDLKTIIAPTTEPAPALAGTIYLNPSVTMRLAATP